MIQLDLKGRSINGHDIGSLLEFDGKLEEADFPGFYRERAELLAEYGIIDWDRKNNQLAPNSMDEIVAGMPGFFTFTGICNSCLISLMLSAPPWTIQGDTLQITPEIRNCTSGSKIRDELSLTKSDVQVSGNSLETKIGGVKMLINLKKNNENITFSNVTFSNEFVKIEL